jgi:tRNA pseudouridine55 synthase
VHGWIILDKPLGLGSTQAVSAVKRALRTGGYPRLKVGHGGTLDPLATGVLPIATGEATKLAGRLLDSDKTYAFTIKFGEETSTLDAEGEVVRTAALPTRARVWDAIRAHQGSLEQTPPAFSAIKVDGERAYDRARAGESVPMPFRKITVYDLYSTDRLGGIEGGETLKEAHLRAHVSKGTYVRSLARDIADHAGTVGHVAMLRRIKAGPFTLAHAITLDKLDDFAKGHALEQVLLPLRAGLDDIPALSLTPDQAGLLRQGRQLIGIAAPDGQCFAMLGDTPVALAEVQAGTLRVVRGFNL